MKRSLKIFTITPIVHMKNRKAIVFVLQPVQKMDIRISLAIK